MSQPLPGTLTETADTDLVSYTRAGDHEAYAELWRRHSAGGRTVARSITSTFDPDDLVQEAFTRIYVSIEKGGGPTGAFRPYLFTTIRNTAAEWGRKRQETSIDTLETLEDPTTSSEATTAALDRSLTATAFRSLPTRWQEVLWYTEVEQMTPQEVGPLLGMKANGVSALAYRAREGLRQAWIQAHLRASADGSECRWTIERLGSYTRNSLGDRDTTRLENHLDTCARCTVVAAEARDVGSRIALVLLPLSAGIAGATGYLAWLQTGGATVAATTALPATVVGGSHLSVAGLAGAGTTGTGSAAGGSSAGGGSAAGGGSGGATGGGAGGAGAAAAGASVTSIAVMSTIVAAAVAAAVVGAVTFGPGLFAPSNPKDSASQSASSSQQDEKQDSADSSTQDSSTAPTTPPTSAPTTPPTAPPTQPTTPPSSPNQPKSSNPVPAPVVPPGSNPTNPKPSPNPSPSPSVPVVPSAPVVTADVDPAGLLYPVLSGDAEKNADIEVYSDGKKVADVKAAPSGKWEVTITGLPADGIEHALTVKQSIDGETFSAPSQVILVKLAELTFDEFYSFSGDGSAIILTGTGVAGSTITLTVDPPATASAARLAATSNGAAFTTTTSIDSTGIFSLSVPVSVLSTSGEYVLRLSYAGDAVAGDRNVCLLEAMPYTKPAGGGNN